MRKKVECAGIIPLKKEADSWRVLLIRHKLGGHWGFPKGHTEPGESLKTTAERELKEECNLDIADYFDISSFNEKYSFYIGKTKVNKSVTYFLAKVSGEPKIQLPDEIADLKWVCIDKVHEYVTFDGLKALCKKITCHIKTV